MCTGSEFENFYRARVIENIGSQNIQHQRPSEIECIVKEEAIEYDVSGHSGQSSSLTNNQHQNQTYYYGLPNPTLPGNFESISVNFKVGSIIDGQRSPSTPAPWVQRGTLRLRRREAREGYTCSCPSIGLWFNWLE